MIKKFNFISVLIGVLVVAGYFFISVPHSHALTAVTCSNVEQGCYTSGPNTGCNAGNIINTYNWSCTCPDPSTTAVCTTGSPDPVGPFGSNCQDWTGGWFACFNSMYNGCVCNPNTGGDGGGGGGGGGGGSGTIELTVIPPNTKTVGINTNYQFGISIRNSDALVASIMMDIQGAPVNGIMYDSSGNPLSAYSYYGKTYYTTSVPSFTTQNYTFKANSGPNPNFFTINFSDADLSYSGAPSISTDNGFLDVVPPACTAATVGTMTAPASAVTNSTFEIRCDYGSTNDYIAAPAGCTWPGSGGGHIGSAATFSCTAPSTAQNKTYTCTTSNQPGFTNWCTVPASVSKTVTISLGTCANGATNYPTCTTCAASSAMIGGVCTPVTVSVTATTPYNTTPSTNVSFTYAPTTNTGATECRLLDNTLSPLTAYQASSPIIYASPSSTGSFAYYVQCRNTTTTTATNNSNQIIVNVSNAPTTPSIGLPTVTAITNTGATLGANVTSDGGSVITARGTCWGTMVNPVTNCISVAGTIGIFTDARTGMSSGTLYHYRAYATNTIGTSYTSDATFTTTAPTTSTVSITAGSTNIPYNTATNLSWSYTNATSCTITPPAVVSGYPNGSGSVSTGNLSISRTYTISCNPVGPNSSASITVNVAGGSDNLIVIKTGQGTVVSNPAGIGCGSTCSASYSTGSSVTLTETPAAGRIFTGWSGVTCDSGNQKGLSCSFTINSNLTVLANFIVDPSYKEF